MNDSLKYYLAVCAGLCVIWCGALGMPFAQDDFIFLLPFAPGGEGMTALLDWRQGYFRPVSQALFFRVLTLAGTPIPVVCHLIVFALYLGVVGIYFDLVRRLTCSSAMAALASFIFGSRSSHFLAVAWLSAVQEVIMAGFALGAMWCVLVFGRQEKIKAHQMLVFAFLTALALFSKETAIVLPLLSFAMWFYFKRQKTPVKVAFPFLATGILAGWIVFRLITGVSASYGASLISSVKGLAINIVVYPLMFFDINREILRHVSLQQLPALSLPLVIWCFSLICVLAILVSVLIKRRSQSCDNSSIEYRSLLYFVAIWGVIALIPALLHTKQFYGYYALLANGGWVLFAVLLFVRIFDLNSVWGQRTAVSFILFLFMLSLSSVWLQAHLPYGNYQRAIRVEAVLEEVKNNHPDVVPGSIIVIWGMSSGSEEDARLWRALGRGMALPFTFSDASMRTHSAFYPPPDNFDIKVEPTLSLQAYKLRKALEPESDILWDRFF
jgi:hypothetical protein